MRMRTWWPGAPAWGRMGASSLRQRGESGELHPRAEASPVLLPPVHPPSSPQPKPQGPSQVPRVRRAAYMANTSQPLATPSHPPSLHLRWSLTPLFCHLVLPNKVLGLCPAHPHPISPAPNERFPGLPPKDPQRGASLCLCLSPSSKTMSPLPDCG